MTATDELRRMLDERGVEWRGGLPTETMVEADGLDLLYAALPDGRVRAFIRNYLTPEQAIEATLGRGTCHDVADTPQYGNKTRFECSECGYEYSAVGGFGCDYGDEPDFNYCPNCGARVVK